MSFPDGLLDRQSLSLPAPCRLNILTYCPLLQQAGIEAAVWRDRNKPQTKCCTHWLRQWHWGITEASMIYTWEEIELSRWPILNQTADRDFVDISRWWVYRKVIIIKNVNCVIVFIINSLRLFSTVLFLSHSFIITIPSFIESYRLM